MKAKRSRVSRRAFLRGAGTIGVALPFLEGLPERSAWAQTENPVFGLFICTANGVVQQWGSEPERFWPTELGPLTKSSMEAFASERCTGILADYADKLLIVRGVNYPAPPSGCGHAQGLVQCLTGRGSTGAAQHATSTGPSADTVIAEAVNPPAVEPLTLYSGMKGGYIDEKLSFRAAGQVRAAEGNPYNVYQRLVGLLDPDTGAPSGMAERLALRRKSVNDLVREELSDLLARPQLSKADRDRLDLHFTTIRDIEVTMGEMGATCTGSLLNMEAIQAMNSGNAFRQNGVIEEVAKLQMELVALTFACNQNRVATLQIGDGTDGTRYTVNGQTVERFHWVSHRIQSDGTEGAAIPQALEWHAAIDRIRMNTFKHLLDKWSEYSTAQGSLLDNAFAMWTSHVATGPPHGFNNLPIIIAGSAGGYLKQGHYVDAGGAPNTRLLNTLIAAMGGSPGALVPNDTSQINALLA
ncbi:MAG: DUF1552 domain-containing protein [Myxococcales bacterium]|jgi:hypothetical protein|nr:DUF1552 domain-containing protein [Myxococcales bacterium]